MNNDYCASIAHDEILTFFERKYKMKTNRLVTVVALLVAYCCFFASGHAAGAGYSVEEWLDISADEVTFNPTDPYSDSAQPKFKDMFPLLPHGLLASMPAAGGGSSAAGSGDKSADDIAKELTNPNNDLAKLTFKNQYRFYTGDLPGADKQDNYTLLFQPVFPFSLGETDSGDKEVMFVRPAIPFVFDQPVPDFGDGGLEWDGVSGMGDIGFDVAYGQTSKTGWIWAAGMVGTLPTATNSDIAGKQLRLGPEALLAHINEWGLLGAFPSHQWDVTGWGDDNYYSTSSLQLFAVHTAGDGWTYGTEPIMNYNWVTSEWTVPANLYVSKTVIISKTPWKFELDLNYYVDQPDAFGPEWMIGFNFTPVIPNFVENWIKGL